MANSIIDDPTIMDALQSIQAREGRADRVVSAAKKSERTMTVVFIPISDAPLKTNGFLLFTDGRIRNGHICRKQCSQEPECGCFNRINRPTQWAEFPPEYLQRS